MCIVLKAGVDNSIMWRYEAVLIATVKIDSVGVEEQTIPGSDTYFCFQSSERIYILLNEEQVHVDGHQERNDEERRGSEQLVHGFVSND